MIRIIEYKEIMSFLWSFILFLLLMLRIKFQYKNTSLPAKRFPLQRKDTPTSGSLSQNDNPYT